MSKENIEHLGIYGGTFAPVHNGHIYVAKRLIDACRLDRLLIIPTSKPVHKDVDKSDDPIHRLQMLRLAFQDCKGIDISDFEIQSPAPSYTAITLTHFAKQNRRLTFFVGTDMFLSMDTWYRPQTIFSLAKIVHMPRTAPDETVWDRIRETTRHYEKTYGAEIEHLDIPPYPLSSTDVRARILGGESIDDLVPDAVAEYIDKNRLYRKDRL